VAQPEVELTVSGGTAIGMTSDTKSTHISGLRIDPPAVSGPADVMRRFNTFWIAGDIDSAILLVGEHAVYALYISGDLLPFGGETAGRDNIATVLRQIRRDYEYLLYRPLELRPNGNEARFQVEFMYRHLHSGEVLSG